VALESLQICGRVEVEVADRQTHDVENSGEHFVKQQVFFVRTSGSVLDASGLGVVAVFVLAPVDDSKNHAKNEKNDEIQAEEWLKINEDLTQHRNQEGKVLEHSQEEEGLEEQKQGDDDHEDGVCDTENVRVESLDKNVSDSDPDVSLIDVVPWVREVLKQPSLEHLHGIVAKWIQEADKHSPAKPNSIIIIFVQVNIVDKGNEETKVSHMHSSTKVMNVFSISVPLEVVEVLNNLCFKDLPFLCLT
jgi:hypothetical protein